MGMILRRVLVWSAWLVGLPLTAAVVALGLGALLPRGLSAPEGLDEDGPVVIYAAASAVHIDLILPTDAAGVSWRGIFAHLGEAPLVAFGWGDRAFYLATPSWADLDPALALTAAFGSGQTVVRATPRAHALGAQPILLSPFQYRQLVAGIQRQIRTGPDGAAVLVNHPGYGVGDRFAEAHGRYSALVTCNEWVAARLAEAGLAMPRWSPLPQAILWWLQHQPVRE